MSLGRLRSQTADVRALAPLLQGCFEVVSMPRCTFSIFDSDIINAIIHPTELITVNVDSADLVVI